MKNIFKIASKDAYRYNYKGIISTEDLWNLSPEQLDELYKDLSADVKQTKQEDSLLTKKVEVSTELENKIQIVKEIVEYKLERIEKAKSLKEQREFREKLLRIKQRKEEDELNNLDIEEIDKLLKETK